MIDKNLLDNLNDKDKESLKNTLDTLISQTYVVENEYKSLNASYKSLQNIIEQIIESLPNAIWVLAEDYTIFLQNTKAKEVAELIDFINIEKEKFELEFKQKSISSTSTMPAKKRSSLPPTSQSKKEMNA